MDRVGLGGEIVKLIAIESVTERLTNRNDVPCTVDILLSHVEGDTNDRMMRERSNNSKFWVSDSRSLRRFVDCSFVIHHNRR